MVVLLVLALVPVLGARRHLLDARGLMQQGREALLAADPQAAERRFREAEVAFVQARDQIRNPLLGLAGVLPILGRTPDAAEGVAEAGAFAARAGTALAGGIARLPEGLGSLGPREGRIPVEPYRALGPALEDAAANLRQADEALDGVAESWVAGPVADARRQFVAELTPAKRGLEAASVIVTRFPMFLGSERPMRYFFAAENPAELRGSGGLIGSYAILTADRGRLTFSPFRANETLPQLGIDAVEPPNPDYARRYPGAASFLLNANVTPDFPSAAVAVERLYQRVHGVKLDGAIAADPFALEAMMAVTGPVEVQAVGKVEPGNIVDLVTNRAYSLVGSSEARNRVLGDVAQVVVTRFLRGTGSEEAASILTRAVGSGHVTVHTADPVMQRGLSLAGADGALPQERGGDFLAPILNNGGGNKVDFYQERTVRYAVDLGAAGAARADLSIEVRNEAPRSGQPRYVIGPNIASGPGESVSQASVFLAPGARAALPGADGDVLATDRELGYTVVPDELRVPSGESGNLRYSLAVPHAWSGSPAHGVYRLTFVGQTTIRPTDLSIEIRAPAGTRIVRTSVPMTVEGDRAIWTGVAPQRATFEVEFQKPVLSRTWDAVVRFFTRKIATF